MEKNRNFSGFFFSFLKKFLKTKFIVFGYNGYLLLSIYTIYNTRGYVQYEK